MEKKEKNINGVIRIHIPLALWLINNFNIAGDFLKDLNDVRKDTDPKQFESDSNYIGCYPFIDFNEAVEKGKISSVKNARFWINYGDNLRKISRNNDFNQLMCDDKVFKAAVNYYKYLCKNVGINNIGHVVKLLDKIDDLEIEYLELNPNYPTSEEHRGSLYYFTDIYLDSINFKTKFDYTDGNINISEDKISAGYLNYSSSESNFTIKNIFAFPKNCKQFDFAKHVGEYKEGVRYPDTIYVNNLLFDDNLLPGCTVEDSLFRMFPNIKKQIDYNYLLRVFKNNPAKYLDDVIKVINDKNVDKGMRLVFEKEVENYRLKCVLVLKKIDEGLGHSYINSSQKEDVAALCLVDDGK